MTNQEQIVKEVLAECTRQNEQWGGPEHDDEHVCTHWRRFRRKFEDRVEDFVNQRGSLIKIAALALAQIEAIDRNDNS